jgi:hypothetical protein
MPEQPPPPQNPLDLWRQYITDSERQWNAFFKEVLGTDSVANSMNAWVEASLTVQRMVADQLERLYTTFNIPTHSDLVDLGERMKAIEESLARLELIVASASSTNGAARPAPRPKPARTRKPPTAAKPAG